MVIENQGRGPEAPVEVGNHKHSASGVKDSIGTIWPPPLGVMGPGTWLAGSRAHPSIPTAGQGRSARPWPWSVRASKEHDDEYRGAPERDRLPKDG